MRQAEPSHSEILLSTQGLSWRVGSQAILNKISLTLPQGATAGLIGPNGAGKTSLLHCLNGFHRNYSGDIQFAGKALNEWPRKALAQRQALVSQQSELSQSVSLFELVRMGLIPYKYPFAGDSQADLALISASLDQVGLLERAGQAIDTLSGGELQRALIAKALVQQPELLLLDEPTNHLDLCFQLDLMKLIQSLPITTLASLHDINLAAQFCDWLILIKDGEILSYGPTEEIFTESLLTQLFERDCVVDEHPYHQGLWMNFKESAS